MQNVHPALQPAVQAATTLTVGPQLQRPGDPEPVPTEIGALYYWLVDKVFTPLKQQETAMAAVPGLLGDMAQQLLGTVGDLTSRMSQQFTQLLAQQAQVQAQALAEARTAIHAEILGSAAPLLATIQQIQALDLQDEAADAAIHNQLLAALGAQSTQLQATVTRLDAVATTVSSQQQSLNEVLTVNVGQTQDIAAVRLAQTALRTDLTTTQQQLTTTTATAGAAQQQGATNAAAIATLQTDVQARLLTTRIKGLAVPTPAMAVSATATITVTWPVPFPDDKYVIAALPETSALLGSFQLISHSKEGCVVSVKNVGLVALLAGAATLHLTAFKYS